METTDVDKMKKLSTIRNQKMPKNRVIHEVMNIIHIIWDKLFWMTGIKTNDCFVNNA